jgi:hypothetical protein
VPLSSLLVRTYVRYVLVVTVLAAIAFTPILWLVSRVHVPADANAAKGVMRTTWLLVGMSLVPMLLLVGGVTPAVRSIAVGAPLSQARALSGGVIGLVRAAIPVGVAVLAMLIGSLALAVPGLVLFVLLALSGATADLDGDLRARLAAGAAIARSRAGAVAVVLAASIALTVGGAYMLQRGLPIPLPKQPTPEQLAAFRQFARHAIAGIAFVAPLPAIALAALAIKAARPSAPA